MLRPLHGTQHLSVAVLGLGEFGLALPAEVGAGELPEFCFPFGKEGIGHALDVGDFLPDRFGTVLAVLEFTIELLVGGFEVSTFVGDDFAELLECGLNFLLGVFLCIPR